MDFVAIIMKFVDHGLVYVAHSLSKFTDSGQSTYVLQLSGKLRDIYIGSLQQANCIETFIHLM